MTASRPSLTELDDACTDLLRAIGPMRPHERVSLDEADGRVLAEDVFSVLDVPAFDNSSMDGWAVRSSDFHSAGAILTIAQRIAAGDQAPEPLKKGEAARIFTGAPIPPGADAVIMQENANPDGHGAVHISNDPKPGQWIRRSGEDIRKGQSILPAGHRLRPADLGLLASLGLSTIRVSPRPRVALFTTGNELVTPGEVPPERLPPGKIFNSNRYVLKAMLLRLGAIVTDLGRIPDSLALTQQALHSVMGDHDLVLTSGGVSVGEEDHVKPAVESLGSLRLWSLSMKPGKPFAYGQLGSPVTSEPGKTICHFMGLPGNPVSSFVTFLLLVRPFLLGMQGVRSHSLRRIAVRADFDWLKPDRRREFIRARWNDEGGVSAFQNQSSGVLTSVSWADGLVDVPSGQVIRKGDMVQFLPWPLD